MRYLKFGKNIIFYTLLFNLAYTAYYGFNLEPINETEAILDKFCEYMFALGMVLYISPFFTMYENNVERYEKIKKRKKTISCNMSEEHTKHTGPRTTEKSL